MKNLFMAGRAFTEDEQGVADRRGRDRAYGGHEKLPTTYWNMSAAALSSVMSDSDSGIARRSTCAPVQ